MDGLYWPLWLEVVLTVLACALFQKFWTERRSLPPGPLPWPILGNLPQLGGVPHQKLAELAKRYGPLMYLKFGSKGTLVVSSPRYAEEVLKNQDVNWVSRPFSTAGHIMMYGSNDVLFSPRWQFYRLVMLQELITSRRVEDFKKSRQEEILNAIKWSLKESSSSDKVVEIGFLVRTIGMNIGTRMLMNEGFLSEKAYSLRNTDDFDKATTEFTELLGTPYLGDLLPWLDVFDIGGLKKRMRSVANRFNAFFQTVLDDHKRKLKDGKNEGAIHDIVDAMLSYRRESDERKLEDSEIKGIMQDILLASIDTTSNTIEWALSELLKHPDVMGRVQAEMDAVVGRERLVDESDLPNLPFLQAVMKETLRLHPVLPLLVPHASTAPCTIEGYKIPAGTQLFVNVWAIHRDPGVWDRALEFDPSRFLDCKIDLHGRHFELLPFGSGRRMCLGKALALLQTSYVLALLVQTCEWRLPEGMRPQEVDMEELTGLTLARFNPMRARALPRVPRHLLRIDPTL